VPSVARARARLFVRLGEAKPFAAGEAGEARGAA